MSAVATGLWMALLTSGQAVEVAHVAPDVARVTAAHDELGQQNPRAHPASGQQRWTPVSSRQWSRAPRAPLAGALVQGGGGVALPLT